MFSSVTGEGASIVIDMSVESGRGADIREDMNISLVRPPNSQSPRVGLYWYETVAIDEDARVLVTPKQRR